MKHESLIVNALWLIFAMVALCAILDMAKQKPPKNGATEALKSARAGEPVPEPPKRAAILPPIAVVVDGKITTAGEFAIILMDDGSIRWEKRQVK